MLSLDKVGEDALAAWKSDVDLGDHVFVHGEVITSRRGELSVLADEWQMAAKALRPLPIAHKRAQRGNACSAALRRPDRAAAGPRYGADARRRGARAARRPSTGADYLEVETPMLQTMHGGATARPFVTHSNAFDIDLFLRIAPELFLKRCVVGGIERVFEINRNFRNEGTDSSHSPEFAMLESYQAYGDYNTMADAHPGAGPGGREAVLGIHVVDAGRRHRVRPRGDWTHRSRCTTRCPRRWARRSPRRPRAELLRKLADAVGLEVDPRLGHGKLVEELWEHLVGDHLHGRRSCATSRSTPRR